MKYALILLISLFSISASAGELVGSIGGGGGGGSSTITAGTTATSGVTSGNLIGSASNLVTDSGVAYSNFPISGTVNGDIVKFSNTTGAFADSGVLLSSLAPLASPGFTGIPLAPTATVGTNTTQIATTAFVLANAGGGSGTVTSVGFTGGLISVGTPTTTPAFTVAGTSGGIPYFSSASTWATSAALAANALVIGGGAGVAPATTTTGTGVLTALGVNTGSAGAFVVNGGALGAPSSGTVTNLTGTASININGTVGATTPSTGAFTTASATTFTGALTGHASLDLALTGGTMSGAIAMGGNNITGVGNVASTTFNGNTITTGTGTLTIAAGKTLTDSNTLTFTGTDGSSVAFGTGGTVLYGNQTVTLSGDVTGSGTTAITTVLATAQPAVHSWALAQTFTTAPVFTDQSGSRTALGLGTMSTQNASAVAITGGTFAGITGAGFRDASAAFDDTLAFNSSVALTAGRTLTLDMGNVAHTLKLGTTANTITFPNLASYTVITNGDTGTVTNTMLANASTTVNGQTCTLGSSCTITATASGTLTFGTHLTSGGSSYNGSTGVTITSDATSANTASTIVARDASNNFSAGTITASLTGHASLDLALTGGTMSGAIAMGGNNITGGGTAAFTTATFTTGGTSNLLLTATSNYNVVSLNNTGVLASTLGLIGGASGDASTLYLAAPSIIKLFSAMILSPSAADTNTLGQSAAAWLATYSDTYISRGAVPTGSTGTCTTNPGSFTGGSTAGKFTATCTAQNIILTALPTAPNGYSCDAYDQTTPANLIRQTANTATSVTFGAVTTGVLDTIIFKCTGW